MIAPLAIRNGDLEALVTPAGGCLLGLTWRRGGESVPLLRPATGEGPLRSAAFPMVPFGNRLRGNAFSFAGREHRLAANTPLDPLHLHGDGWLATWRVAAADARSVHLTLDHEGAGRPYRYRASLRYALEGGAFEVTLGVVNRGPETLPFGLGWHPYLPLMPGTLLEAPADSVWLEGAGHLPTERVALPPELDFTAGRAIPQRWINNSFDSWSGRASVWWPERDLGLSIEAGPLFRHYVLFVSDKAYDPDYANDFFCFEPMSHAVGAHHLADLGGLVPLAPGEGIEGRIRLSPQDVRGSKAMADRESGR